MKSGFLTVAILLATGATASAQLATLPPPADSRPPQIAGSAPVVAPQGQPVCCPTGGDCCSCPAQELCGACCPCPAVCPCGPPGRFWVRAEYLLWSIKDTNLPPLVTVGPGQSTGILGQPGVTTVLGGGINKDTFNGGRFTAGMWLDCEQTIGLEGSFFFLAQRTANFAFSGTDAPGGLTIARPFFNTLTGQEDSQLVARPGQLSGTVLVSQSDRLYGGDLNGICNLCCGCQGRVDFLAGFRYLQLDENLTVTENLQASPGLPLVGGTQFGIRDQFEARNRFYGGQVGARSELWYDNFFVGLLGKVALGVTDEESRVRGSTLIAAPNAAPVVAQGGLLALPSNSGSFDRTRFAVVTELGLTLGYQLTQNVRVFGGYTFLYWSEVLRNGGQIDRGINPTQLPTNRPAGPPIGTARPAVRLDGTDFWAQGVSFGVELRF